MCNVSVQPIVRKTEYTFRTGNEQMACTVDINRLSVKWRQCSPDKLSDLYPEDMPHVAV